MRSSGSHRACGLLELWIDYLDHTLHSLITVPFSSFLDVLVTTRGS